MRLASDSSLTHVWTSVETAPPPMIPRHVTKVALAYSSGIQVTIVPWQYGRKAPPFSQAQVASHYKAIADESLAGAFTISTIEGIPVLVNRENVQSEDNPGVLEFQLGTANANAVTVQLVGPVSAYYR